MPSNDWNNREPPRLGPPSPDRPDHGASTLRLPTGEHHGSAAADRPRGSLDDYGYAVDRGRGGIGRKLIYAFLTLVALFAIGLGVLVVAPPVDLVRSHVVAEVERQTGRKLTIGSAGVSFASGLGVSLDGVTLSAPPGMEGSHLLAAERIEVSLGLLPLVAGEIQVDRLTLVRPVVDLRIDRDGRRSWRFARIAREPNRQASTSLAATGTGDLPPEVADFMRNASPPEQSGAGGFDAVALSDVRIVGGTVRYADARSGFRHEVTGIDATLSLPHIDGPLTVDGTIVLAGQREALTVRLDDVRGLLSERAVDLHAAIKGKVVDARFEGRIAEGAKPLKEGKVHLTAPSANELFRAFGLPIIGADSIGAISLEGDLRATDDSVMITSAKVGAGASSGTGTLGVERNGTRSRLIANMQLAALHLDPLLAVRWDDSAVPPPSVPDTASSPGRFAEPEAAPPAPGGQPSSIGDLLKRDAIDAPQANPATRVKGFRKRLSNQWDVDAIETASLRAFDVEGRFQIAAVHTGGFTAESLQTGVELKDGILRVSVTDGRLSGGTVRGLASVDARQPAMTVAANITGEGVGLKPLLELAGIDLVDGKGRIMVSVNASGGSERELVSSLAGRAEIKATEGALVGWDAEAILADIGRGRVPPTDRNMQARTPFKALSGNFQIAQGVARSQDLLLESGTVSASGTATINIVDRNVDVRLKPRISSGGLEVPVRIAGQWDAPTLVADVSGALKSPQAKEAVRHLKDGNVEGALRSVLGKGPKADQKIDKAKELLKGLLGR